MRFGKNFSGNAYIVFPAEKAKYLVDACTGETTVKTNIMPKLTIQDFDVIKEISNIILNAVIGEFSNLLDVKLQYSIPVVEMTKIDSGENEILPENMHFLAMFNSFYLSKSQVRGLIFVALSVSSEKMLMNKLNEMLVDIDD
jgi:chemotaxis protein CheC